MIRIVPLWRAAPFVLALAAAGAAQASESTTTASIDVKTDTDSNTAGGVSESLSTGGSSFAKATADLFSVRAIGEDGDLHFAAGRPEAFGQSDFDFEVQGATGVVELTFNFETTGEWEFPADNYTALGTFAVLLGSATGVSPQVEGKFNIVQATCCGGRYEEGSIRTYPDRFDQNVFTEVDWFGANPGGYSLTTTFLAGTPDAGSLGLRLYGAGGNVDFDFGLRLASITTTSTARGLSIYDADTGQRFAITPAVAAGVPEPAAWALMILGFGATGAALRGRARPAVRA